MKIGVVDVDTSHPQNWIPIERELGHEVTCVWDGGAVHPKEYVEKFATDHKLTVCTSLEDMVKQVDCAIIHGCDWDTHVTKAQPFVEAGKSVLIDKPVAGSVADLKQFQTWVDQGARISGGSSLRFCAEVAAWLAVPVEERGTPHTVVCGCAVDDFNYGIHAYSMLGCILGAGAKSVRHLGKGVQRRIQITWPDGRMGFLIVGQGAVWMPFYAQITTERKVHQIVADNKTLYRCLLQAALPYLSGQTPPPISFQELVEPERWAIAARLSWQNGDAEIQLADLSEKDSGYDGADFAVDYRKSRYPKG